MKIILLAFSLLSQEAHAATGCDFFKESFPEIYKLICKEGKSHRPSGANSTFADAFKVNPSSLPTQPSPYGVETIGSYIRIPRVYGLSYSLIKGFKRIGTGVSTSGNNTFYGNDVIQRSTGNGNVDSFKPHETQVGYVTDANIGTAIQIVQGKKDKLGLSLGLSLRYNKTTNTFGGGTGLLISRGRLSFGLGLAKEKVSNLLPIIYFGSAFASITVLFFEFEYTMLKNFGGPPLDPIHIGAITIPMGRFSMTGAARYLNYYSQGSIMQYHGALQVRISNHLSLGALYNYIPGATSVAMQLFL